MITFKYFLPVFFLLLSSGLHAAEKNADVGADLYQKKALPLSDIPKDVIALLQKQAPGFAAQQADTEYKNSMHYMDVEGKLPDGSEIEFDLLLENKVWKIVEIQRDISPAAAPEKVMAVLKKSAPDFTIDRIIESDQGDGVIIYEFYSKQKNQKTLKREVKLQAGKAEMLEQHWHH